MVPGTRVLFGCLPENTGQNRPQTAGYCFRFDATIRTWFRVHRAVVLRNVRTICQQMMTFGTTTTSNARSVIQTVWTGTIQITDVRWLSLPAHPGYSCGLQGMEQNRTTGIPIVSVAGRACVKGDLPGIASALTSPVSFWAGVECSCHRFIYGSPCIFSCHDFRFLCRVSMHVHHHPVS